MKKETPKTMVITTLSGNKIRIKKAEVADIIEQNLLLGGGLRRGDHYEVRVWIHSPRNEKIFTTKNSRKESIKNGKRNNGKGQTNYRSI